MKCSSKCTIPKKSSCIPKPVKPKKSPCKPCIHPFEYLIEQAYSGASNKYNSSLFFNNLIKLLERGINFPNCTYCCPDCEGVYVLSTVEEFLDFATAVGLTPTEDVPPAINPVGSFGITTTTTTTRGTFGKQDGLECCSNVYASTEKLIYYNEALGLIQSDNAAALPLPKGASLNNNLDNPFIKECCNGFSDCIDNLTCWITQNSKNPTNQINTLLDMGVVEYGGISGNCTKNATSSVCKLIELFDTYQVGGLNRIQAINDLLQKGIVISCDAGGSMQMASIATWVAWAEASGYTQNVVVPD